jgi:hypothetical protein
MRETLLRNVPTIPNDQTSDFLLYFLLEIDSGAIQRIGPMFDLVLSNQTQKSQIKENESVHSLLLMKQCYRLTNKRNLLFFEKLNDNRPVLHILVVELVTFQNPKKFQFKKMSN